MRIRVAGKDFDLLKSRFGQSLLISLPLVPQVLVIISMMVVVVEWMVRMMVLER